ncbi:MAG: IS1182 family transposase [Anaerolineae bacterium]|nr:IS1182 family transposase [Anaerolineae bacterium]
MSLKPSPMQPVPAETARVARAAFPKGNPYLTLRDELGPIFRDEDFVDLFPPDGQPALPPWRLALVTIMQFRENLSDRQAAEAVRARIDWKYLLGLTLTDPGFDFSVLSEFRTRLRDGGSEALLLEKLLDRCRGMGLVKARGKQRTDATYVLAAIRVMNRLELIGETVRAVLNELAAIAPDWLRTVAPVEWYQRYCRRIEDDRLPKSQAQRTAYAQTVGEDGFLLLDLLNGPDAPPSASQLLSVEALRRVLARHYERIERETEGKKQSQVRFKANQELPPAAEGIESPYDLEARFRSGYETAWTGYLVHLSETCDEDDVHLITHVETTLATGYELHQTQPIQQALMDKGLPPAQHLVDTAYIDAALLVQSQQEHGISLIGPTHPDTSWQARVDGAYTQSQFQIDWDHQQVTCPQGQHSAVWREPTDPSNPSIWVFFSPKVCRACPARAQCTRMKRFGRRLELHPRAQHEALQAARLLLTTEAGKQLYNIRAGIEGAISQGVRAFGLRRTRYRGLAKTHLQHLASAAAINFQRIMAWLNEIPRAKTRMSRFARLAPLPA